MLQFVWTLPKPDDRPVVRRGPSVVELYVHTDAGDFPSKGWDGEPLLLLAAWMNDAALLAGQPDRSRRGLSVFHTGPYYFEAMVSAEEIATLRFLRSYVTGPIEKLPVADLPFAEYGHALLDSGQSLLDTCRAVGFGDDFEWEGLGKNINRLSSALTSYRDVR